MLQDFPDGLTLDAYSSAVDDAYGLKSETVNFE